MKNKLTLSILAVGLVGCAHFQTLQTDTSYVDGKPQRSVTTSASARTFFDSKSSLATWKATQTDKTQSATVGNLAQESSGTNVVNMFEAIARGAAQGSAKALGVPAIQ